MKRIFFLLFTIHCSLFVSFAQERTVTGRIVDAATGQPLAGVIVNLDGIVPAFEQVLRGKPLVDAEQILQCIKSAKNNI